MTVQRIGLSLSSTGSEPHDLHLDSDGGLAVVVDGEAVGQHVRQRLMTFSGEWFLDVDAGVTWLTDILGGKYDPVIAETLTKSEILETDGVTEIESFSVRFKGSSRGVESYNVTVKTDYDGKVVI